MFDFASRRERWLWALVAAVVAGIYATLGVAGELASELRNRDLLDALFFGAFVVMLVAIAVAARRVRLGGLELGVVLAVVCAYMMLFLRMGIPEERSHLIEYSVVALLMHEAWIERQAAGRVVRSPGLFAFVGASVVGIVDEMIQALLPNRVFDVVDIGFNVLAAALAVGLGQAFRRRRSGERM